MQLELYNIKIIIFALPFGFKTLFAFTLSHGRSWNPQNANKLFLLDGSTPEWKKY